MSDAKPVRCEIGDDQHVFNSRNAWNENAVRNATAVPDDYVPSNAVVEAFLGYCMREDYERYCVHRDDIRHALTAALAQIAKEAQNE